jgi:hypothetical protein
MHPPRQAAFIRFDEDDYNIETLSVNSTNLKYDMNEPLNIT